MKALQDEAYEDIKGNLYFLQEFFNLPEDWVMDTAMEISATVREYTNYDLETAAYVEDEPEDDGDEMYDALVDSQLSDGE
jgi:hypothetical protein